MNLKRRLFIPGVSPRPDAAPTAEDGDPPARAAPASEPHHAHAEHAPAGRRSLAARIKLKREARFGIAALLSFLILVGILITSHGKAGKVPPAVGIPNPNVAKAKNETDKDQNKNPKEAYGPSPALALRGSTVVPKPIPEPEPEPEPVNTPPRPIAAVKLALNETSEGDGPLAPEPPPTPEPGPRADEKPAPIEMQPAPVAEPAPSGPAEPNPPAPTSLPKPAPVQEPAPAPEPIEPAPLRTPESAPAAVEPLGTPGTPPPPAATNPPAPVAMPEPDMAATRVQAPAASETAPSPANPRPGIAPVPSNETPDLATPGPTGWVALPNTRNARTLERSTVPDVSLADRPTAGDPGSKELVEPVPHVVQRGENFWTIARQYYNSGRYWKALWAANRQKVPVWDQLYVGTTIRIPPPELLDQSLIEPPKPARASATLSPAPVPLRRTSRPILNSSRPAQQEEQVALPAGDPIDRPEKARFVERAIPDPDLDLEAEADSDPDASVEKYEVNRPVYKVKSKFETLRSVARDRLGDSRRADEILDLNADVIKDPNHLVPGQLLELPEDARVRRRKR